MSDKHNKKKIEQKSKFSLTIAIVCMVLMVAGGTYAFWLWRGNITSMNVAVEIPGIGVILDGGVTTISGLAPASCKNSRFAVSHAFTVKRFNESSFPAYVVLNLSLDSFTWVNGSAPSEETLSNIKFAVSSLSPSQINDTCSDAGILANTTSSSVISKEILTYTPEVTVTSGEYVGSLQNIDAGAKNAPVTGQKEKLLSWIYEIPAKTGTKNSKISETYYIYYWIDSSYTGVAMDPTANGSGVSGKADPLQNMTFKVYWSAGGDIVQVSDLTTVQSYIGA